MLKVFIIKKLNKKSFIIDGTFVGKIVSIYRLFFSLNFLHYFQLYLMKKKLNFLFKLKYSRFKITFVTVIYMAY